MSKWQSGMYEVVKQMASDSEGLNMRCYRGLLELLNRDRKDIVLNIKKLQSSDPNKYTPEHFANYLSDIDTLIKRYDGIYTDKALKAGYSDQEYIERKVAYDVGESDIDPDAR